MAVTTKKVNTQLNLMSAIAIILVVCGHESCNLLSLNNLFPYYSYHMPLFMFISGYFYSPQAEQSPFRYLWHKAAKLLGYFIFWQIAYALLADTLRYVTNGAFTLAPTLSFASLIKTPLLQGTSGLTGPSWYLVTMFYVLTVYLLLRKALTVFRLSNEYVISLISLAIGCAGLLILGTGEYGWPLRRIFQVLYFLPCLAFGRLYRTNLEKHDKAPNILYFGILFLVQALLLLLQGETPKMVAAHMTGFTSPLFAYGFAITGIALVLRISRLLDPVIGDSPYVLFIGRNTKTVMMHHMFFYFLIHAVLAFIATKTGWMQDIDPSKLFTNIYYHYYPRGLNSLSVIYVILTTALPLLLLYLGKQVKKAFKTKLNHIS